MQRRDFMKRAIMSSLAMSSGGFSLLHSGKISAQTGYDGPLLFLIDAAGAWEPVDFCSPLKQPGDHPYVAVNSRDEFAINQELNHTTSGGDTIDGRFATYSAADILSYETAAGQSLRVAPMIDSALNPVGPYMTGADGNMVDFFDLYKDEMLVVNGINTSTNSHSVGQRQSWSGTTRVGFPSIGALWAAVQEDLLGAPMAMSFTSTGGYDATAGLVSAARAGQKSALVDLTNLFSWAPSDPEGGQPLYTDFLLNEVLSYQNARTDRMLAGNLPPHVRANIEKLQSARLAEPNFQFLADSLEQVETALPGQFPSDNNITKASTLIAAMKAGICTSAMLSIGGFDTHSNHFANATGGHPICLQRLFNATHYVVQQLMHHGLWERSIVVMASDFGRTRLNGGAKGKDHWPTTSYIMMGQGVGGGRQVGYTYINDIDYEAGHDEPPLKASRGSHPGPVRLSNGTLIDAPLDMVETGEAFAIKPAHIHYALRELLGMNGHPIADSFGLPMDVVAEGVHPFFSGL
jgi:uncharacterized protein (DUF1501 family)